MNPSGTQVMSLATYAMLSVFLAFTAYRVLPGFAWYGRGMDNVVGSGQIRQVDEGHGPAGTAATNALNVMNNMTPGGMASLMCACMFLFGAVLGGLLLPAMFMAMEQSNALSKCLIAIAAIAWAVTLASSTFSVMKAMFYLAMLALVLIPLGALGFWIFGGPAPVVIGGIEVSDMHGMRELENKLTKSFTTKFMPIRYEYNLCTLDENLLRWKGVPNISRCAEIKR